MVDKSHYNCVLSQTFSPCGKYLVCGNNYGDIVIYELTNILGSSENSTNNKGPNHSFTSPNHEYICSLTSTTRFLIAGTVNAIYGWDWESIKEFKPRQQWKINLPSSVKKFGQDVNSLFVIEEENVNYLYAGCGDNNIYVFSLEDGNLVRTFDGHTDYLHSICHFKSQMASGGEDGIVRLWDLRQQSMVMTVEPSSDHKLARPHLGKWVGDIDLNETLLVCGGGFRPGIWELRNLDQSNLLDETHDAGIHVAKFHNSSALIGGNDDYFYRFDLDGKILSKIDTSSSTIYSAEYTQSPIEVLSLAGSSQSIDLCTDFTHRYQVLSFFQELI